MKLNRRIVCADGFTISIQANEYAYCEPRISNAISYTHVEMGYPNRSDDLLLKYAEDFEYVSNEDIDLKQSVYPYTPANVVKDMIERHGGMLDGELPNGININNIGE